MSIDIDNIKTFLEEITDQVENAETALSEIEEEHRGFTKIPYLTSKDQLKADQLIEHWEKIKLSDIDKMIASL